MPPPTQNRWTLKIVSPIDSSHILYETSAPSIKELKQNWDEDVPDNKDFLSVVCISRSSRNKIKNNLVRVYKIGEFENYGKNCN